MRLSTNAEGSSEVEVVAWMPKMSRAATTASSTFTHLEEYRTGREEGFSAGVAAGRSAVAAELEALTSAIQSAVAQIAAADAERAEALPSLIMALAVELATEILGRELSTTTDFAEWAAKAALASATGREKVTLYLNPEDAQMFVPTAGIEVVEDARIPRATARATVGEGVVDLSVDAALVRVREELDLPEATRLVSDALQTASSPRSTSGEG